MMFREGAAMDIKFGNLHFIVLGDQTVVMSEGFGTVPEYEEERLKMRGGMVEIQCAGDEHPGFGGSHKRVGTVEKNQLKYVSHSIQGNRLCIVTRSKRLEVESYYCIYEGTNAVRTWNRVTNIGEEQVTLESVASALLPGLGDSETGL